MFRRAKTRGRGCTLARSSRRSNRSSPARCASVRSEQNMARARLHSASHAGGPPRARGTRRRPGGLVATTPSHHRPRRAQRALESRAGRSHVRCRAHASCSAKGHACVVSAAHTLLLLNITTTCSSDCGVRSPGTGAEISAAGRSISRRSTLLSRCASLSTLSSSPSSTRARCIHALAHRRWSSLTPIGPLCVSQSKRFSSNIDLVNYLLTWAYIVEMVSARIALSAPRPKRHLHHAALRLSNFSAWAFGTTSETNSMCLTSSST